MSRMSAVVDAPMHLRLADEPGSSDVGRFLLLSLLGTAHGVPLPGTQRCLVPCDTQYAFASFAAGGTGVEHPEDEEAAATRVQAR